MAAHPPAKIRLTLARILFILAAIIMVAFLCWDHHRAHYQGTESSFEPTVLHISAIDVWTMAFKRLVRFRMDLADPAQVMGWTLFLLITAYHLIIFLLPWCVTLLSRSLPLRSIAQFLALIPTCVILFLAIPNGQTLTLLPLIAYTTLPAIGLFIIPGFNPIRSPTNE
jgi:hypothetical protein